MSSASSPPPSDQWWRIVIIDDSEDDRAEVKRLLRVGSSRRYEFVEAADLAAGVQTILGLATPPDCAVVDFHLPDGTGAEVVAALTGPEGQSVFPIVMATGSDDYELGRQMLRAGAQDFIGKGWMTAESMTRAVENAVERWHLEKQLRSSTRRVLQRSSAVPHSVWTVDEAGRLTSTNERWRAYFGSHDDPNRFAWGASFVHPGESVAAGDAFAECLRRGVACEIELRLRRHDGEYRWHQVNVTPVLDAQGAIVEWYGVSADVHARKEAETRLRLALEATATGIWIWEISSDAVAWSAECYAIHGLTETTFGGTGAGFFALVHADDRARVETEVRAAIRDAALYRCEFRVVRPDGRTVWVENLGRASYDVASQPLRVLGTITDITDRKTLEEALHARERELHALVHHTPDIVSRFDRELRHTFVNSAITQATGLEPAALIGKTHRELGMPDHLCEQWEAAIRGVFATGQPASVEFEFPSPGGARAFMSRLVGQTTSQGAVESVLVVANDVTDRKRVEVALRTSEERLAGAQKAANIGTWDWDVVSGEVSWTDEAWALYARGALRMVPVTFETWLACVHPEDRVRAAEVVSASLLTGRYLDEIRVRYSDGTIRWLEGTGEAVFGPDGAAHRMVGTVRDVTVRHDADVALRLAVGEAQRALAARDQLVSLVSHDLRTPLATLAMAVSAMEGQVHGRPKELLNMVDRQARRMHTMIDELLDASQMQKGHELALQLQEVDLAALVHELCAEHQQSSPRHLIEADTGSAPLFGQWDPARLQRVVSNLLSNAVKYSPKGGTVHVAVESDRAADPPCAVLRVSDEGIGIPEKDQGMIFQWFSRAENASAARIPGIGIGLAGVQQIVAQHGGSVSVESEERRGSTFTVRLPLRPAAHIASRSAASSHSLLDGVRD